MSRTSADRGWRSIAWQTAAIVIAGTLIALVTIQTATNLKARGIASGFEYLTRATGFALPPGLVPYASSDTYARALAAGVVNTLRVTALGILIATVLGAAMGIARLSPIWVVATISRLYVEVLRNTPLLLQLLFWYALSQGLPGPRDALNPIPGVYLCIRGLYLPALVWEGIRPSAGRVLLGAAIILPVAVSILPRKWADGDRPTRPNLRSGALVTALALAVVLSAGIGVHWPVLTQFDFHGGLAVSPEFAALLIGLSTYTSAFIAEIVRGGILSVSRGQTEAAAALGLSRGRALRFVVLPQALRVIVPPTTSQFLSLAKNSSLAVAIGYADLMSVTDTTLNQTGQAVEAIAVAACMYLLINLAISFGMNRFNRRVAREPAWGRRP